MKSEMLFEKDGQYIVSKDAGDSCVPDKSHEGDLQSFWEKSLGLPLHVVTRLDRPVSGLVLLRSRILPGSNPEDEAKSLTKVYLAAVRGKPSFEGRLTDYLIHDQKRNVTVAGKSGDKGAKKAVLDLKVLREGENYSLCRIVLETGRHHQIRAQLGSRGTPVAGDTRYGAKRSLPGGRLGLHCVFIGDSKAGIEAFFPPEAVVPWSIFGDAGFYSRELVLDGLTGF